MQKIEAYPFFTPQFVLPPGTEMSVTVPKKDGDAGEIVLKNDLVTIKIRTIAATYVHSIGKYAQLAGITEEEDKRLMKIGYLMTVTIEFNPWKGGNPRMSGYRGWAEQIKAELRDSFDEQLVWARIKNDWLLQRQIEYFGPINGTKKAPFQG